MIRTHEEHLAHYGIKRRSGRYPWGSGDNAPEATRSKHFLDDVALLKKQKMSEADIAKGMGYKSTTDLRNKKSQAKAEVKAATILTIERHKEKGMKNTEIARLMGIPESTVRLYLQPGEKDKADVYHSTANMLRGHVKEKDVVDVGRGVAERLKITPDRLKVSVAMLKDEGYGVYDIYIRQLGTGNITTMKVLAKPGITRDQINKDRTIVKQIDDTYSEDRGHSYLGTQPPLSINSKRVAVVYGKEGAKSDGMIYVRPGVERLKIGNNNYGQVRIMVDGTHYLKGMAAYKGDLPKHIDVEFHTKKDDTGRKKDAMKELEKGPDGKVDPANPFGTIIRQVHDPKTGKVTSAMNLVGAKEGAGEEGYWDTWSRSLSSQMLSKQDPALAKQQLDLTYERRKNEHAEIMSLTNHTVRQQLLYKFADEADAASAHLKAANLPRQSNKVLLPVKSMNPKQIHAPSFDNGERVVLIRFPHGGTFEIPELTVNNRNKEAKAIIGTGAKDAVGVHWTVAQHLSGADFDGDTVLVIPNKRGAVKTTAPLEGLKDFDPMKYKIEKGSSIKPPTAAQKGTEMGKVSNLITDMTLQGASTEQLARAIKHSMVVIDSEKHGLDFRQSEKDHGIRALKQEYQLAPGYGASTIISRKKGQEWVPERQLWSPSPRSIDPKTGEKIYKYTGKRIPKTVTRTVKGKRMKVEVPGETVLKKVKSTKGAEARDAFKLVSGNNIYMETLYANHSNRLKALANESRKTAVLTKPAPQSKSAKNVYKNEVDSLKAKLDRAKGNAPLERQAQLLAGVRIRQQRDANPTMDKDDEKKMKFRALDEYRERVGAKKDQIVITPKEWEAIQAGAISNHMLTDILANADIDRVKYLALPKTAPKMTSTKILRAQTMLKKGYTQAEVAEALGVGLTTLKVSLSE